MEVFDKDVEEFYQRHRGGSGAVLLVTAITPAREEVHGIFGSAETARAWIRSLPEHMVITFSPYIVDDPDWGNEVA